MTINEAIEILYSEATSEDRTHSLEQINEAKELLEKEHRKVFFFFSQRKELEKRFIKWAEDGNAAICPFNVITFLSCKGLLKESKIIDFLNQEEK